MLSPEEKARCNLRFEASCEAVQHSRCICCRMVGINVKVSKKGKCTRCVSHKDEHYLEKKALPVWYKDGIPQYHVPKELKVLTQAECMLIQRVSPFVALYHIKHGTFGLTGHTCAFEQNVDKFMNKLPRRMDDVVIIKVLKKVTAEIGSNPECVIKNFRVRKTEVFLALAWLKKYNNLYSDITIDMSVLDVIQGESGILPGVTIEPDEMHTRVDGDHQNTDMGPAHTQALDPGNQGDNVQAFSYLDTGGRAFLSEVDAKVNKELRGAVSRTPNARVETVDWPDIEELPVNEFGDKRIFALAFPWLFPGGEGDVKDFPGTISTWGKQLLYYEDGRFARDRVFTFFALNYIVRHRNHSSGRFFVNQFHRNCPDTLEELKEEIERGDSSFVSCLTYYNKRITGSSPFWHEKRQQLYSWINHHVEAGNGAPTYFITLSCAEYFWPDIIRLIKERLDLAGEDSSQCYFGSKKLIQYANDYSIVIQEYFQKRVEIWLETVGKEIFGINHYWVRYEFAPGRGQIHAHLLAISGHQGIYKACHAIKENSIQGKQQRADLMATWAKEKFGLTASVSEAFGDDPNSDEISPSSRRYGDIPEDPASQLSDVESLLRNTQLHRCSEFCLKKTNKKW